MEHWVILLPRELLFQMSTSNRKLQTWHGNCWNNQQYLHYMSNTNSNRLENCIIVEVGIIYSSNSSPCFQRAAIADASRNSKCNFSSGPPSRLSNDLTNIVSTVLCNLWAEQLIRGRLSTWQEAATSLSIAHIKVASAGQSHDSARATW